MMNLSYRPGTINDLQALKSLALKSWSQFQPQLTPDNWLKLYTSLNDNNTYRELLETSTCFTCTTEEDKIIGMAFLVSSGHPTVIYDETWSYIRFISVDPDYEGLGIGRKLTALCIDKAKQNGEHTIALHTSELMNKARHIYESIGFTILKEIDERLGKKYWLYTLSLKNAR